MPIEDTLFAEIDIDLFKKGELLKTLKDFRDSEIARPIKIKGMRIMIEEINKAYQGKKGLSKDELRKIWEKHQDQSDLYIGNTIDSLKDPQDLFVVRDKKIDRKGNVTIKLKKVDTKDRDGIIKQLAKRLVEKLNKKQLQVMIEEGLKKNSDFNMLKEANKEIKKKKPKLKEHRGCFIITVNDKEVMVVG